MQAPTPEHGTLHSFTGGSPMASFPVNGSGLLRHLSLRVPGLMCRGLGTLNEEMMSDSSTLASWLSSSVETARPPFSILRLLNDSASLASLTDAEVLKAEQIFRRERERRNLLLRQWEDLQR